jgi:hypothetical protein
MWRCLNCREEVEERFDACWNCEADRRGRLPTIRSLDRVPTATAKFYSEKHRPKRCLRCNITMRYAGAKDLDDGPKLDVFSLLFGELFANKTILEMYLCPSCFRVEFFVSDPNDMA